MTIPPVYTYNQQSHLIDKINRPSVIKSLINSVKNPDSPILTVAAKLNKNATLSYSAQERALINRYGHQKTIDITPEVNALDAHYPMIRLLGWTIEEDAIVDYVNMVDRCSEAQQN